MPLRLSSTIGRHSSGKSTGADSVMIRRHASAYEPYCLAVGLICAGLYVLYEELSAFRDRSDFIR
jgi:hypothetical protein